MSFAGHVFDMIRRNKEDREKLSQLRGKGKDMRTKYSSHIPNISVEEYEKINQQLKEREKNEQTYISLNKTICFSCYHSHSYAIMDSIQTLFLVKTANYQCHSPGHDLQGGRMLDLVQHEGTLHLYDAIYFG